MRKYEYVAWQDEGLWTAHSPSVPGVYGVGSSRREAESDFVEALTEMLSYLNEIGQRPPKAKRIVSGVVEIG